MTENRGALRTVRDRRLAEPRGPGGGAARRGGGGVATRGRIRGYGVAGRRAQFGGTLEIVQFGLIPHDSSVRATTS
jgi:hypothetical protein